MDETEDKSSKHWGESIKDEHIYAFLTAHYLQQNQLSWSRTQTIVAIEAGILTASYALKGLFGIVLLLIGSVLILSIYALIKRDWEVRDQNLTLLDRVHEPHEVRMIKPPKYWWRKGSVILPSVIYFLALTNIALTIYFICMSK